jgi:hypothetical protein
MGWSIGYIPPQEPELLDRFFLTVGKALFLASEFEEKCRFVLRITKLAEHYESTGDTSATRALAKALKDQCLGPTLRELKDRPDLKAGDIALLERARDARNFIAHEVAILGGLSDIGETLISQRIKLLRAHVVALTAADNMVSRWVYEIEEKEPAPDEIQEVYPELIARWVFRDFDA